MLATTYVCHYRHCLAHIQIPMLGESRKRRLRLRDEYMIRKNKRKVWQEEQWESKTENEKELSGSIWIRSGGFAGIWRLRHGGSESVTEWLCSSERHEQIPLFIRPVLHIQVSAFGIVPSSYFVLILKRVKNNLKNTVLLFTIWVTP